MSSFKFCEMKRRICLPLTAFTRMKYVLLCNLNVTPTLRDVTVVKFEKTLIHGIKSDWPSKGRTIITIFLRVLGDFLKGMALKPKGMAFQPF